MRNLHSRLWNTVPNAADWWNVILIVVGLPTDPETVVQNLVTASQIRTSVHVYLRSNRGWFSDEAPQIDRVNRLLLASADLMKRSGASCTGLSIGA